jgi:Domain of unknown function (DUF6379)
VARGNFFGYDSYMICEDSLRNVSEGGEATGFALDLRIANYRGYLLSQIEDVRICIDGHWMDRDRLRFAINGKQYSLLEMETVTDNRWGILDRATLTCLLPGGLQPGSHEVTIEEHIRASYIPMTAIAFASKTMNLAQAEC